MTALLGNNIHLLERTNAKFIKLAFGARRQLPRQIRTLSGHSVETGMDGLLQFATAGEGGNSVGVRRQTIAGRKHTGKQTRLRGRTSDCSACGSADVYSCWAVNMNTTESLQKRKSMLKSLYPPHGGMVPGQKRICSCYNC